MSRYPLAAPVVLLLATATAGAEPARWEEAKRPAPDGGYPALVCSPTAKAPEKGWPVVVWLHGFSLRGEDLAKLKEYGPPAVLDALPAEFVLVAPQLPAREFAWRPAALDAALAAARKAHPTDPDRVGVVGASLGAAGAFEWAAAAPERFAGLVMLAGSGAPAKAKAVAAVPAWLIHGSDDKTVPVARARATRDALADAGGAVTFTELPGVGHNADKLTRALIDEKALAWLLSKRRKADPPAKP